MQATVQSGTIYAINVWIRSDGGQCSVDIEISGNTITACGDNTPTQWTQLTDLIQIREMDQQP